MAFADQLLTDTDASIIIVDRHAKPGGHWNDAYPFVRLHGPSLNYGVNSTLLGSGQIEQVGVNAGMHELATGPEICSYFDQVMRQRFLPSGRVKFFPLHEYVNGVAAHLFTDARTELSYNKKLVDCTVAETRVPAVNPPPFEVAENVRCIPLGELVDIKGPVDGFTIIGAGKTAMDAVVWLREQGVEASKIAWVRPREPWMLNRRYVQPSFECFEDTMGSQAHEFELALESTSASDLFLRLEQAEIFFRIDTDLMPNMFRCPVVSEAELACFRSIKNVIRQGHVVRLEANCIISEQGITATTPNTIHVHCCADGIPLKEPRPIFQGDRIEPQYLRRCNPTFSAAVVAYLEAKLDGDDEKNAAATPSPIPDEPLDWLRGHILDARNQIAWRQIDGFLDWLATCRLDGFTEMMMKARAAPTPEILDIKARFQSALKPRLARMQVLLNEAEHTKYQVESVKR